jgi:hypothetical protein
MKSRKLSRERGILEIPMATTLAFVYSSEFRGWACNKCDWRFPVSNLAFTDAHAEEVVAAFGEHRCGDRARLPPCRR